MSASDELLHRNIDKEAKAMTDPTCPNCGKSLLECQGFCPKKGMREKIGEIIEDDPIDVIEGNALRTDQKVDQILSLLRSSGWKSPDDEIEGWVVVEECPICLGKRAIMDNPKINEKQRMTLCSNCKATGKLTRPATLRHFIGGKEVRKL